MKFRTDRILGAQLDWAVAVALGLDISIVGNRAVWWVQDHSCTKPGCAVVHKKGVEIPRYSADWGHGGLILEREFILLDSPEPNVWTSSVWANDAWVYGDGPTALIAAMRAYVASKLGNEINVPEGLC